MGERGTKKKGKKREKRTTKSKSLTIASLLLMYFSEI
jgi:hypothetical protein